MSSIVKPIFATFSQRVEDIDRHYGIINYQFLKSLFFPFTVLTAEFKLKDPLQHAQVKSSNDDVHIERRPNAAIKNRTKMVKQNKEGLQFSFDKKLTIPTKKLIKFRKKKN